MAVCLNDESSAIQLYYFDFALGLLVTAAAMIVGLGGGLDALPGNPGVNVNVYVAAAAGPVFTLGNLLLVSAVELVGLAVFRRHDTHLIRVSATNRLS